MIKFRIVFLLMFYVSINYSAETDSLKTYTFIPKEILELERKSNLTDNWLYSPGDNPNWKDPEFDDSEWESVKTLLKKGEHPKSGWPGIGWFRLHIEIDSMLVNHPLGYSVVQAGASEIYLNGVLIDGFGIVSGNKDLEQRKTDRTPRPIKFRNNTKHVIAVRYSNHIPQYFNDIGIAAGFGLIVDDLFELHAERSDEIRVDTFKQVSLMTVAIILGLFHLIVYFFDRRIKENLYYFVFLAFFSLFVFNRYQFSFFDVQVYIAFLQRTQIGIVLLTLVAGAATIFAFVKSFPRFFNLYPVLALILGILFYYYPASIVEYFVYSFMAYLFFQTSYILFQKKFNQHSGISILRFGYGFLVFGLVFRITQLIGLFEQLFEEGDSYIIGVLWFIVSMSIIIAKQFTENKKNLEKNLVEVKELSEKTIQQERQAKQQEIKQQLLEADNKRKTEELEQARELQLSMLPKTIPEHNDYEISVFMETATEVGGDYYDFNLVEGDHLTVAIGDATGHGTKAGIMVATIKGLFSAFVEELGMKDFFNRCTSTIKRMELERMLMSLTLVKLNGNKMAYCAAGMPPIYLYKAADKSVEEIVVKGMPLGAMKNFPYQINEKDLSAGDTILLLSDGFPELFNERNEMYDYPKTKEFFGKIAEKSTDEIIEALWKEAQKWMGNQPQDDDITFVVIKAK